MTPDGYIRQLEALVGRVLDQEALDFAARFEPKVRPPLTPEQHDYVGGLLEGPSMFVAMIEAQPRQATRTA